MSSEEERAWWKKALYDLQYTPPELRTQAVESLVREYRWCQAPEVTREILWTAVRAALTF